MQWPRGYLFWIAIALKLNLKLLSARGADGGRNQILRNTVFEFERQVLYVVARIQELESESRKEEGWVGWLFRMFSGTRPSPG